MQLIDVWKNYQDFIPYFLVTIICSFLITPLVGKFAFWIKAIDLPANLRSRTDKSKEQRIHSEPKLRLGGLGIVLVFILIVTISGKLNTQITGILIGSIILLIIGFFDDRFEISPKVQLFSQLCAATIVVISGISIHNINIAGFSPNLDIFHHTLLHISNFTYTFVFPADFITIFWILILINAMNWMCGIDALGENISIITGLALSLTAMKGGHPEVAFITFIFVGSIIGFVPYNFPPSKIMGGTIADANYGFLLSTLAILGETKLSTTVLLLVIPIIDMIYVLIRRIVTYKVFNPAKLLGISGSIHLHHRLMNLGFDKKSTLYVEMSLFSLIATIALYFEKVGENIYYVHIVIIILLSLFLIYSFVSILLKQRRKKRKTRREAKIILDISPEEKYKY